MNSPEGRLAMYLAKENVKPFKDSSNPLPIDEDDVAFMYLIGFITGLRDKNRDKEKASKKREHPEEAETPDRADDAESRAYLKKMATWTAHHFMQKGYNDKCDELRGIGKRYKRCRTFRLSLE
jgi:hypothetical protein